MYTKNKQEYKKGGIIVVLMTPRSGIEARASQTISFDFRFAAYLISSPFCSSIGIKR